MPLRPIISTPSLKALGWGIGSLVLVFGALTIAINLAPPSWSADVEFSNAVALGLPLISYVVSGIVVGMSARRSPIMHGVLLGLAIIALFAAITRSFGDMSEVAFVQKAVGAVAICTLGSVLGDYLAHRRAGL